MIPAYSAEALRCLDDKCAVWGVNNTEFPNPLSVHLLFHRTLLITPVMDKVYADLYFLGIED